MTQVGLNRQAATLLEITTQAADDIGHGFSYFLWYFKDNWALVGTTAHHLVKINVTYCLVESPIGLEQPRIYLYDKMQLNSFKPSQDINICA